MAVTPSEQGSQSVSADLRMHSSPGRSIKCTVVSAKARITHSGALRSKGDPALSTVMAGDREQEPSGRRLGEVCVSSECGVSSEGRGCAGKEGEARTGPPATHEPVPRPASELRPFV